MIEIVIRREVRKDHVGFRDRVLRGCRVRLAEREDADRDRVRRAHGRADPDRLGVIEPERGPGHRAQDEERHHREADRAKGASRQFRPGGGCGQRQLRAPHVREVDAGPLERRPARAGVLSPPSPQPRRSRKPSKSSVESLQQPGFPVSKVRDDLNATLKASPSDSKGAVGQS